MSIKNKKLLAIEEFAIEFCTRSNKDGQEVILNGVLFQTASSCSWDI